MRAITLSSLRQKFPPGSKWTVIYPWGSIQVERVVNRRSGFITFAAQPNALSHRIDLTNTHLQAFSDGTNVKLQVGPTTTLWCLRLPDPEPKTS